MALRCWHFMSCCRTAPGRDERTAEQAERLVGKMKKTKLLTIFFCISAAVLLIGALRIFRLNHNDSPGWRLLKTQDSYALESQQMNGADSHTLDLTAGDVLQVEFAAEKGFLYMEITAPDGTVIYAGNGKETTAFELNLSETGAYTVAVEARHAKGKINIWRKDG